MKYSNFIKIFTVALVLLQCQLSRGQGTLRLSNLDQPTRYTESVAADAWISAAFNTGSNSDGYRLDSISFLMDGISGSPVGFNISLYEAFVPDTDPLVKIGDLSGADPTGAGVFSFEASGIFLSPSAAYSIVLTSESPAVLGAYLLSVSDTQDYFSDPGWIINGSYDSSENGSDWSLGGRQRPQFAVYATVIPEPSTLALIGGGAALLIFRWRRRRKD